MNIRNMNESTIGAAQTNEFGHENDENGGRLHSKTISKTFIYQSVQSRIKKQSKTNLKCRRETVQEIFL